MPPPTTMMSVELISRCLEPGRVAGFNKLRELLAIALGIHARPESAMSVNVKLTVPRELHQRIALEHATLVLGKIFPEIPVKEKITAVDPVILNVRLLREFDDTIAI